MHRKLLKNELIQSLESDSHKRAYFTVSRRALDLSLSMS